MKFKRSIYQDLLRWKSRGKKKPLLLMGARQIGKTTVLKSFGAEYNDCMYINFERQQDIHSFFKGNKDPKKILERLTLLHGRNLESNNTLLIFDEIQECRDALITLKYFAEEMPNIHIIGAGSLLGLSIGNNRSFPVGKVEFLSMYPLSFKEFLRAADAKLYQAYQHFISNDQIETIPEAFFSPLKSLHKEYILFGGMPEVASAYLQDRNIEDAQVIQDQILQAYALDFVKHTESTTSTKIQQVWNSLPSQLARENKKFIFKTIKSGARAREYEEAIQWLVQAGLVYKVSRIEKPFIPMKAYEDITAYKLYIFETGLLMRLAGLDPKTFINGNQFFSEFKGAIAENHVAQAMQGILSVSPYYWTSKGKAEVDFIVQHNDSCIPVEVKSGEETKAKSLSVYKEKYRPTRRLRVTNLNLIQTDDLINVPLFYSEELLNIVDKSFTN